MSDVREKFELMLKAHEDAVDRAKNDAFEEVMGMMIDWKADNSNRVEQCRGVSEMINLVGAKIG